MSDDIAALKDRVIEAARAWPSLTDAISDIYRYRGEAEALKAALLALKAAEDRARKPRLKPPMSAVAQFGEPISLAEYERHAASIVGRDAEWIAATRALPRHQAMVSHFQWTAPGMASGGLGHEPAVLLRDIESLLEIKP